MKRAYLRVLPVLIGAVLCACNEASGRPAPLLPIADFFRSSESIYYKLSPGGGHLAYIGQHLGHNNIFIRDTAGGEPRHLTSAADRDINRFAWGNDDCILYLQDNAGDENYRLYRIDIASREATGLTDFPEVRVNVLDLLLTRPDEIIVTMNRRDPELSEPWLLNIVSGEQTLLAENPGDVRRWMADNDGVIRIARADVIRYRPDADGPFRDLIELDTGDTFDPQYFTPDNRSVYAYSNVGRDKIAIVEFDLEQGRETRVLFEHPDFDAFGDDERDHFVYSAIRGKPLYALFTGLKRELHFFDDEVRDLHARLSERLGDYEVLFYSLAPDLQRAIVEASSDRRLMGSYLYDAATDELTLLGEAAPWLEESHLAEMHAVRFKSRDGLDIHGYLTLPVGVEAKNLPVIVNPHAGPQWRNTWGFDARSQFLANRGYAVLHVNFRGSEGYGKAFMKAGFKQWGLKMQDDISDGVLHLVERGIADPDRVAILGWSFGGFAALAGLTFTPELYVCGVDMWGMSNYFTFYDGFPARWKPFLAEVNERWGDPVADRQQMHDTSPVFHVANIRAPLLIAHAENDTRVRVAQTEELTAELEKHGKTYEVYIIEGEGHAFSDEGKQIALMEKIEGFLAQHMR